MVELNKSWEEESNTQVNTSLMLSSKVLLSVHDLQKWKYLSVIMQSFDALVRFTNLQLFFTPSCTYIFWKWPWHFVLPHSLLNHYRRLWFYSPPRWRQHDIPTQIVAWCTIGFVPIHAMQYLKYNYLLPPAMICLDMTRHNTRHSPPPSFTSSPPARVPAHHEELGCPSRC